MTFAQLDLREAFLEELCNFFIEKGLATSGRLSVEAIQGKARSLVCASGDDQAFTQASEALRQYANRVFDLYERIPQQRLSTKGGVDRPSASASCASAGGAPLPPSGDRVDASNVGKRPRTGEPASTPDLDDRMAARTTAFTTASPLKAPSNPFCEENASSSEGQHFAPLLIAANLARRKVCAAIARMGALLVDMPEDQILEIPNCEFAAAPARGCADASPMPDEGEPTLGDILHELGDLRSAAAELKAATSRAVNVY
jgi:hypothetical protein